MKMIKIKWLDSTTTQGWELKSDRNIMEPMSITSIGWVLSETELGITICSHIGEGSQSCDAMTIPKSAIVKRENINED